MKEANIVFEAKGMRKTFGPTVALKKVDIVLKKGEIRGLVGENGSGKSTVMSIASGMQPADQGEMFFMGRPWQPENMIEAQKAGISMILQEANTIPGVSVAQNIFAGREKEFASFGMVRMKKMYDAADKLLQKFGITHIRSSDLLDQYQFEDRKLIEIVRCVGEDTKILVIDETTTALSLEDTAAAVWRKFVVGSQIIDANIGCDRYSIDGGWCGICLCTWKHGCQYRAADRALCDDFDHTRKPDWIPGTWNCDMYCDNSGDRDNQWCVRRITGNSSDYTLGGIYDDSKRGKYHNIHKNREPEYITGRN